MSSSRHHYRANGGRSQRLDIIPDPDFIVASRGPNAYYSTAGVVYPSKVKMGKDHRRHAADDSAGGTFLDQRTRTAGRGVGRRATLDVGLLRYHATDDSIGWLTIDNKVLTWPINYTGEFWANESPYSSDHAGGSEVRLLRRQRPARLVLVAACGSDTGMSAFCSPFCQKP